MRQTLSYDALPPDSDLSHEFSGDGVMITTGTALEPAPRTVRWARRAGAWRAIVDCVVVTSVAFGMTLLLPPPAWRSPNLPRAVFPIAALFVAAVYLLAWKFRRDGSLDALAKVRCEVTVIEAAPAELTIEARGPKGNASHRIAAKDLVAIELSAITTKRLWE